MQRKKDSCAEVNGLKRYFADKTGMRLLRLSVIALTALMMLLSIQLFSAVPFFLRILLLIWLIVGGFFIGIYLPLYFRNTAYFISHRTLIKQSGIFFVRKQTLRADAIQYTTAVTGPFSKSNGLNLLILNALGGRMMLFFLSRRDMDEILRLLRTQNEREETA